MRCQSQPAVIMSKGGLTRAHWSTLSHCHWEGMLKLYLKLCHIVLFECSPWPHVGPNFKTCVRDNNYGGASVLFLLFISLCGMVWTSILIAEGRRLCKLKTRFSMRLSFAVLMQVLIGFPVHSTSSIHHLWQRSPNCGPWATCGLPALIKRPARPPQYLM